MPKGYRQVSLPDELYEMIRSYVDQHPEYSSVADFVKETIRNELKKENSEIRFRFTKKSRK